MRSWNSCASSKERMARFLASLLVAGAAVAEAQTRPFTLEDMAAFKSITDVALSPDGRRVAFLADRDGSRQVWALPVSGGEAVKLTSHGQSISAFDFSPDGKLVAFVAPLEKTDE